MIIGTTHNNKQDIAVIVHFLSHFLLLTSISLLFYMEDLYQAVHLILEDSNCAQDKKAVKENVVVSANADTRLASTLQTLYDNCRSVSFLFYFYLQGDLQHQFSLFKQHEGFFLCDPRARQLFVAKYVPELPFMTCVACYHASCIYLDDVVTCNDPVRFS